MRSRPMYDVFSKGNYVGSYPTKAAAEDAIRSMAAGSTPERANGKSFTAIRSTHYIFA